MQIHKDLNTTALARGVGITFLIGIIVGIVTAIFISAGIDINTSADIQATAENMMSAESRLHAKAYIGILGLLLEVIASVGLFLLLCRYGPLLGWTALALSLIAATLILLGAVSAMNAAEIASNTAFLAALDPEAQIALLRVQVTQDYTSFHLSLLITTMAKAIFFYLFLKSALIPKLIAGWGLFASVLVVTIIILRDFIPALGSDTITIAFMVSNLVALIATGLYLTIKGVRESHAVTYEVLPSR